MKKAMEWCGSRIIGVLILCCVASTVGRCWPMAWCGGPDGAGGSYFAEKVFNIGGNQRTCFRENKSVRVQLVDCSVPANICWPGDKPSFTFQVENLTDVPLTFSGKIDVIQYALHTPGEDFFTVNFVKLADCGSVPFSLSIDAHGYQNITVPNLPIPEKFGGYGIVFDFGPYGRLMGATTVRAIKPQQATNPQPFPRVMMDCPYADVLTRLGAVSNRTGGSVLPVDSPEFTRWYADFSKAMREFHANHITTTIEFGKGQPEWMEPNGSYRGPLGGNFKDAAGNALYVSDTAWLPKYDKDFQEEVRYILNEYGWPKGPIVGVKLYNEPWEAGGVDAWGADMLRYREMYTAMAQGVEAARKESGAQVLIGGCDSTSNTFDKLFPDGSDTFLKWLDFTSMHYQGMTTPSCYKPWRNRKDENGNPAPVRMWDTESWVANSDERVAAVLAAYCSVGYQRVVGIFGDGFIQGVEDIKIRTENGTQTRFIKRPWSVCASLVAFSYMIGNRDFKELLYKNGLPWVMVFNGMPDKDGKTNIEDGTVVVVGDLGLAFNKDMLPFRTIQRKDAKMIIRANGNAFSLYDSYANAVPTRNGVITLPLDGSGYYLRGDGKPGSFDKLLNALKTARLEGIDPVEIIAHDLLAPISERPSLRLSITNVLNRPVTGTLTASLAHLSLDIPQQTLTLQGNETREISIPVIGGTPTDDNSYLLQASFNGGANGKSVHNEVMHVNVIAHQTPTLDGKLDSWKGVLPQPVVVDGVTKPTTEELAWRPWVKYDAKMAKGFALGYLAYDDSYFYFAAKIADNTPDEGMHRMENSNDDEWFYPEVSYKNGQEFRWPEGVRRYSYAKAPDLPAGNFPNHDNVQIGFNVLSDDKKDWLPYPPGTRPDYGPVPTNDYEYALNPIAAKYGGGTEIWRLHVPGMQSEKHFYPRQPQGPLDGPVKNGKLVITRDDTTRYVECALPWSEIPYVKRALDQGQSIKFSFRVNDNTGNGCMELSRERSVAKRGISFEVTWMEHWTNQLEFAFQK